MRKFKFTKLLVILLVVITCILCSSCSDRSTLTTEEKVQDFEQLYDTIKTGYPYLEVNKRLNNIDWLANKEAYIKRIKSTKSDKKFIKELSSILKQLNNSHTEIVSTSELLLFYKNAYKNKNWFDIFDDPKVMERYPDAFDNKTSNTTSSDSDFTLSANLNLTTQKSPFILSDISEGTIGYINLPQMLPQGESIDADMKEIYNYVKTIRDYKAIVIDIRGNGGGADEYWSKLMSMILPREYHRSGYRLFRDNKIINNYLKARDINCDPIEQLPPEILKNAPKEVFSDFKGFNYMDFIIPCKDSINFQGKLFLLTDRAVFSDSEALSVFCKENKIATLIGETTSGDAGSVDPVLFKLNNSGLVVRMSSTMLLTGSGLCNEEFKTVPDYIIENPVRTKAFKDDKCIAKVLELMK